MPYLPGHPKFKCVPGDKCKADCCRKTDWKVPLSKREFETITARTGTAAKDFTTVFTGYPAFPYLPALKLVSEPKGHKCMFLSAENTCQIHAFKPAACVKYPFTVFPFGRDAQGKLDWFPSERTSHYLSDIAKAREAVAQLRKGNAEVYFFVLVGYEPRGCPGFTEETISVSEYLQLMGEQFELYLRTDGEFICGERS